MKIIMRISVFLTLLLVLCGTVNVQARKWSPGEAETRAMRGDFNVSDKNQLLADIPEEWKKGHRKLVRDIQDGYVGRGARSRDTEEGLEFEDEEEGPSVIEEKESELVKNWPKKEKEKEEEKFNEEQMGLQDIASNFGKNINVLYQRIERQGNGRTNDAFVPRDKLDKKNLVTLKSGKFAKEFTILALNQDDFFERLLSYENKSDNTSLKSAAENYLVELIDLAKKRSDVKPQLKLIAEDFNVWVNRRMVNIFDYKNKFKGPLSDLKECNALLGIKNDFESSKNKIEEKVDLGDKGDIDEDHGKDYTPEMGDFNTENASLVVNKNNIDCANIKKSKKTVSYTFLKKLAAVDLDNVDGKVINEFKAGQREGYFLQTDIVDTYQRLLLLSVKGYNESDRGDSENHYNDIIKHLKGLTETFYCEWKASKSTEWKKTILKVITNFEVFLADKAFYWKPTVHKPFIESLKNLFD